MNPKTEDCNSDHENEPHYTLVGDKIEKIRISFSRGNTKTAGVKEEEPIPISPTEDSVSQHSVLMFRSQMTKTLLSVYGLEFQDKIVRIMADANYSCLMAGDYLDPIMRSYSLGLKTGKVLKVAQRWDMLRLTNFVQPRNHLFKKHKIGKLEQVEILKNSEHIYWELAGFSHEAESMLSKPDDESRMSVFWVAKRVFELKIMGCEEGEKVRVNPIHVRGDDFLIPEEKTGSLVSEGRWLVNIFTKMTGGHQKWNDVDRSSVDGIFYSVEGISSITIKSIYNLMRQVIQCEDWGDLSLGSWSHLRFQFARR
jgi:hypothetical protein